MRRECAAIAHFVFILRGVRGQAHFPVSLRGRRRPAPHVFSGEQERSQPGDRTPGSWTLALACLLQLSAAGIVIKRPAAHKFPTPPPLHDAADGFGRRACRRRVGIARSLRNAGVLGAAWLQNPSAAAIFRAVPERRSRRAARRYGFFLLRIVCVCSGRRRGYRSKAADRSRIGGGPCPARSRVPEATSAHTAQTHALSSAVGRKGTSRLAARCFARAETAWTVSRK